MARAQAIWFHPLMCRRIQNHSYRTCHSYHAMGPRRCSGFDGPDATIRCFFHPRNPGSPAQGKFQGKCVWCNPTRMQIVCRDPRLRRLLPTMLSNLRNVNEDAFQKATLRIPAHCRPEIVALVATRRSRRQTMTTHEAHNEQQVPLGERGAASVDNGN